MMAKLQRVESQALHCREVSLLAHGRRLIILKGLENGTAVGKYVVGFRETEEDMPVFAFDPACEFHRDIAEKCGVGVRGGGHMKWDAEAKEIVLYGESMEFGSDPDRRASRAFLKTLFPGWKIYLRRR